MEKIKAKLSKGEKIDYEAEMVADYDHKELSEDGLIVIKRPPEI